MGESIMQNGKRESLIKRPLKSYSQLLFCCFLSESWKLNTQSHMHKGRKNQRHFSLYSTRFTGPLHHSLKEQGISREVSLKTFSISPFVKKPLQAFLHKSVNMNTLLCMDTNLCHFWGTRTLSHFLFHEEHKNTTTKFSSHQHCKWAFSIWSLIRKNRNGD